MLMCRMDFNPPSPVPTLTFSQYHNHNSKTINTSCNYKISETSFRQLADVTHTRQSNERVFVLVQAD
jgi:hypothetical protein